MSIKFVKLFISVKSVAEFPSAIAFLKKVRYAQCPMPNDLFGLLPNALFGQCPVWPSSQCPMPYALCPMPYALCPMPYAHEYLIWEFERLYINQLDGKAAFTR